MGFVGIGGRPRNTVAAPDVSIRYRFLQERSEQATREVFEKHGVLNVAVDLIRGGRDEE
ncbi:MAG: hypothetical protein ACHRXM_24965 [Isosphaerales bacterium]